ncbi:MAG: DUF1614 domain-containing protein [Thermoplasmata archaeon]|nr:DUF1614 domain-containing protein [Thermoplasmata archaeon]
MTWLMLLIFLIIAIIFYAIYLVFKKAFEEVGFTGWEASIIVFSSVVFGWINIPLIPYRDWIIGVNLGGAVLPIIISIYLMFRNRVFFRSIFGIAVVAYVAYNIARATPAGIVAEFPWWLLPPLAASFYSIIVAVKNKKKAASTAYVSGTMGALIGADFMHMKELLSMPGNGGMAVIGGASILDMVFLTGIIAVIVDAILYEK